MVFDYVQMIADLSAKKMPAHAYTKEELFVKQFGLTGMKINMSLIPKVVDGGIAPGLDADGNYAWADESFDFEEAKKIQSAEGYSRNCGTIAVGVSDEHIRTLMADPDIRMVIPYHKSGLSPIVAKMNKIDQFVNYTDFQNTRRPNGKHGKKLNKDVSADEKLLEEHPDFNQRLHELGAAGDPRQVAEEYVHWCEENNLLPKFDQFAYKQIDGVFVEQDGKRVVDENYYKLLEDFTVYNAGEYVPQTGLTMTFPTADSAFGSMADLIKRGLEEDAVLEGKRDAEVGKIVDEIMKFSVTEEAKSQSPYSYETLVRKPDIVVTQVPMRTVPTKGKRLNVSEVAKAGREQAELRQGADTQQRVVFIPDLKADVLIGAPGARHGLTGNKTNSGAMNTAEVTYVLPQVLQNSVAVNEQNPRAESDGEYSYVLFGYARREDGKEYLVKSVVNHFAENKSVVEDVEVYDVLKGIKARKTKDPQTEVFSSVSGSQGSHTGSPAARHPNGTASAAAEVIGSVLRTGASFHNASADTISVAELLDVVKENYPELLPKSVREHYGITESAQDPYARYSIANPELSFADQVDLVRQNKLNEFLTPGTSGRNPNVLTNSAVYVAKEPNSLMQELGYGDLAIVVTQDHLRQMMGKREDADGNVVNAHNHQLTPRQVKILPKLLEKPAAVLRAKGRPESLIFVTTEKDYRGRPIIVPIKANGVEVVYDGISGPAHGVTSMYGRDNFDAFFENAVKQGQLVYYKKERIDPILTAPGYQSSGLLSGIDSGTIVGEVNPVVKDPGQRKYAITPEFAEWYNQQLGTDYTADSLKERLSKAAEEHGTIPAGERAYRESQIPRSMTGKDRVSQAARTVYEAKATPAERLQTIEDVVAKGQVSDFPIENKITGNRARAKLKRDGWTKAYTDWISDVRAGKVSADLMAMGAHLLNNAGNNTEATAEQYAELIIEYAELNRNAGRSLQAARILKTLSPEGKLYGLQRYVDKMNEGAEQRASKKKGFDPEKWAKEQKITIDPELMQRYRDAKTDEERDVVMTELQQSIADQMPASLSEKLNNWRYLAMLGNFKTQGRNILGNLAFQVPRAVKEEVAGVLEAGLHKAGVIQDRTRSVKRDGATFKAAWADYNDVRDLILGGGKLNEKTSYLNGVQEKRRIYKNIVLEGYRKATNAAMDMGDSAFCRITYADSLASFMAANGTTWDKASEALKERGRRHAIREAAEATYRDNNMFSELILAIGKDPGDNVFKKVVNTIVEGVLPFKKTPANILARGVEYSPAWVLKSAVDAVRVKHGSTQLTGNDVVNELAKGLTGSALLGLGYFAVKHGLLTGAGPTDDDKEKEFWELQGNQAYSLVIDGKAYTIDWLAPECIPLLVGANLAEITAEEGWDLDAVTSAVMRISDPMLEMSMLQGVNDVLDNIAYAQEVAPLPSLILNALTNYALQYVPTLLAQTERAADNTRRTTYKDATSVIPEGVQHVLGKLTQKVPGLDYHQIPYIDQWGRMEQNYETSVGNAWAQFLSPSYKSVIDTSDMETELQRLYDATGETSVLPSMAPKHFKVDSERRDLSAEEYVTFAQIRGSTARKKLVELTQSRAYSKLSDAEKVDAVESVYEYAAKLAKETIVPPEKDEDEDKDKDKEPQDPGVSEADLTALKSATKGFESLKDADGETIDNSRGLQIMEYVYKNVRGLNTKEYAALFEALGVGKTIRGYSETIVKRKLTQMRKSAK